MKEYSVTFLPDQKTARIGKGETILEAAFKAGVLINNICGGDGVCGKCCVIVKSGQVSAEATVLLNRQEIQRGIALACHTHVLSDVEVEVPPESRVGALPRLDEEDAERFGSISDWEAEYSHEPLSRKQYLELSPPKPGDVTSDQEKVYAELRRNRDIPIMQTGLSVLRQLPSLLRGGKWKVTATCGQRGGTVELIQVDVGNTADRNYGVAVDLGTTTVVAHLVDLVSGRTLAAEAKYNSQIQYGEDVISRIMFAHNAANLDRLSKCLVNDINDLITGLIMTSKIRLQDITYVFGAGNTTMSHLLYGIEVGNIRRDPYVPAVLAPPVIRAAEVGIKINSRGLLGVVPSVGSYVGGDIVAGALVAGMHKRDSISMLIDMGTNSEIVLGNREWLLCCSASAGPAFEGGGICCGMRATAGAIERVVLGERGDLVECGVIGGGKPLGICGSGLIDIVAEMLRVGCIDRAGQFIGDQCGSHLRGDGDEEEFVLAPAAATAGDKDIVVNRADIANFIRAKGSIYSAADALLRHCGYRFEEVRQIFVAGGFGNHLNVARAISIGLLPDLPTHRIRFIGNGSLRGATIGLLSRYALDVMERNIADRMTYLELSIDPQYMNEYSASLFLPHGDIERFPSMRASRTVASLVHH